MASRLGTVARSAREETEVIMGGQSCVPAVCLRYDSIYVQSGGLPRTMRGNSLAFSRNSRRGPVGIRSSRFTSTNLPRQFQQFEAPDLIPRLAAARDIRGVCTPTRRAKLERSAKGLK